MPQNKTIKKRNWAFVAYPESLPKDWLEILQLSGLAIAISPLHDKDFNADGEIKKPHYHIIVCYGNPTTYNNVLSLTKKLNASNPITLDQVRGYYRYLTHKDNPEKAQYDEREIKCLNGFNITDFVELTSSEVLKVKREILRIIRDCRFDEYSQLIDYLDQSENLPSEYLLIASNHTIFFNAYLRSRRHHYERSLYEEQELEYKPTKEEKR